MRPLYKLLLTIAAIVGALCVGLFLGGNPKYLPEELRDIFVEDERAIRAEILDAIEDSFYKEVDEDELNQASYKGIVRELDDRFSHYFTPEEAKLFNQSVSGRFEGVGMTVQEHRARAARRERVRRLAGREGGHPQGRRDHARRTASRSRASRPTSRPRRSRASRARACA